VDNFLLMQAIQGDLIMPIWLGELERMTPLTYFIPFFTFMIAMVLDTDAQK